MYAKEDISGFGPKGSYETHLAGDVFLIKCWVWSLILTKSLIYTYFPDCLFACFFNFLLMEKIYIDGKTTAVICTKTKQNKQKNPPPQKDETSNHKTLPSS